MDLVFKNNKLLFRNGKLVFDIRCCVCGCECRAVWFQVSPCLGDLTIECMNNAIAAIVGGSGGFPTTSGYILGEIAYCYGEDPVGGIEQIDLAVLYRCCGVIGPNGLHCHDEPPGEPLPDGHRLISDEFSDLMDALGFAWQDGGPAPNCTVGADNLIGCAFSDPVVAHLGIGYSRSLDDCCTNASIVEPPVEMA